MSKHCCPG